MASESAWIPHFQNRAVFYDLKPQMATSGVLFVVREGGPTEAHDPLALRSQVPFFSPIETSTTFVE